MINENYEKARQNILHKNIREQIEQNDQILGENIFSLDLSKYSFPARKMSKPKKIALNKSANDDFDDDDVDETATGTKSISIYDLTNNDVSLNDEEKNAIDAIEKVNSMNDDGFTISSNSTVPKFNTFKKSNFKLK